ncbi:T9SS type A sorting domain-containing protein [Raineya sp.]
MEFIYFRAKAVSKQTAQIEWLVQTAINVDKFILERSDNLQSWQEIHQQKWNNQTYFSYLDIDVPFNMVYYRLKVLDKDGFYKFSRIATVQFAGKSKIAIYPNPTSDKVFVELDEEIQKISLQDLKGNKIPISIEDARERKTISLNHLPRGLYILQIHTEREIYTEKLIVQGN